MESWNAKCWNARSTPGMPECWNAGNAGMLECQNARMPDCKNAYYSYNKFFDINNKDINTTWCSVVRAYRATSTTYHGGIYMGLLPNLKHQKNDRSGDPV